MTGRARWLATFALAGVSAFGCNALLGIDDGAYAPGVDGSVPPGPDATVEDGGGIVDGATPDVAPDAPIVKTDAGNDIIAQDQSGVISLVQDDQNLYWLSNGAVMTAPKSGGVAPKPIASAPGATVLAVDPGPASAGSVYVAVDREIKSYPKVTGTATTLTTLAMNHSTVAMGSDGSALLFVESDENDKTSVRRVPRVGGAVTTLSAAQNVAVLGVTKDWAAFIDEPNGDTNRKVYEVQPPSSGSPTPHDTAVGFTIFSDIRTLFLGSNKMYWLDSTGTGAALRSHDRGAAPVVTVATFTTVEEPFLVVGNATHAYVVLKASSVTPVRYEVVRVQQGVGARTSIVTDLENPTGLVLSGTSLFVAEDKPFSKGTIQRIALP
ncbi:MAG: hypothetical protein JST00_18510 [Deltaproteobacteria bacterium]|nr:hypothetical protein [Deltaproteobacteria bacterium]